MSRLLLTPVLLVLFLYACKQKTTDSMADQTDTLQTNAETVVVKVPSLGRSWETDSTLITPESVLFDPGNNVLYVSNIGGVPPNKKDGDGFISKVGLDGRIIELKWATGFDAPKGMGLMDNMLYVTDIDRLKAVDTRNGKTVETWKVPGSSFLNDVAISGDSIIYFTDSDKSTVHQLRKGKLSIVRADAALGGTNGIYVEGNTLWLAGFQSGDVHTMTIADQSIQKVASNIPGGDGIEKYKDGWIVSNWNGEVYYIDDTGKVTEILDTQDAKMNAADIEVIEEKNLLLVPTFFGNRVVAYNLQ